MVISLFMVVKLMDSSCEYIFYEDDNGGPEFVLSCVYTLFP